MISVAGLTQAEESDHTANYSELHGNSDREMNFDSGPKMSAALPYILKFPDS